MIVVVITRSVFERTTQRGGIVFATLDNRHALHPRFEHHRFKPPLCVSPSLNTHGCPIDVLFINVERVRSASELNLYRNSMLLLAKMADKGLSSSHLRPAVKDA